MDKLSLDVSRFADWLEVQEKRQLASLTFPEVSRALRALSSNYIERRSKLTEGAALAGAGKRAAFALFYGPLHFMLLERIIESLAPVAPPTLVDLGCGTGTAAAAWATRAPNIRRVVGIDRNAWALGEALTTYRHFGLTATTKRGDMSATPFPREPVAFLAAFSINELPDASREAILERLIERGRQGHPVLIVEPLAGFVARWWPKWRAAVEAAGGRTDEWRFRVDLPPIVAKLDRAAGLDHRELTGRSLWIGS